MAKKKKSVRKSAQTVDEACVEEAYKKAVESQVANYISNCITEDQNAEQRFTKGLNVIRDARKRALELVKA